MAIENVQRNSTGVVKVTALDAIGNVLPEFAAAASDISITDGTNTYAVSSASWSNGIGLLNVTTPDVTGLKTLTLSVKGSATTLYPDPFQINLVDPYAGRFNTTGGKVIWDMKLDGGGTQAQFPDFSGNSNTGTKINGAAYPDAVFTDTTGYIAGSAAELVLGQYRFGGTIADFVSSAAPTDKLISTVTDSNALDLLTKDVTLTNLPIKSVNMVWWRSAAATARMLFWMYRFTVPGETNTNKFFIWQIDGDIIFGVNTTVVCTVPVADASVLWNGAKKIAFISATWSVVGSTATISLTVNGKTSTGSIDIPVAANASPREFSVGSTTTSDEAYWGEGSDFACLDFCAYGDEKNADFFRTNRAAWGL